MTPKRWTPDAVGTFRDTPSKIRADAAAQALKPLQILPCIAAGTASIRRSFAAWRKPASLSLPSSAVIRLRQSIESGLRHPLLGPLLVLFLGLLLAFVIFHTVEHGVEGLLFSCAILAAVSLRLVVVIGRSWRAATDQLPLSRRAPPRRAFRRLPPSLIPPVLFVLPLRL